MSPVQVSKLHTLTGHRDGIYTLQRSDRDNIFFSAAGDGLIVSWDLLAPDAGTVVAKLPNSIYALHHHAASNRLIAGHNYDGIHVLDWENKTESGSLQMTKAAIFDIQSDGNTVLVAAGDGRITKVDLSNLVVESFVQVSEKSVRTLAIHPQRREVAAGCSDHFIRVYDLDSMTLKFAWQAHQNSVFTLRYSPDGRFLLSGSRDARLKSWDVASDYTLSAEVVAHLYAINYLDFSPDGKHFVTCSMDKSIKVWDLAEMKLLKVIDRARHAGHGNSVNKVLWTTFYDQLVSAGDDRTISIWKITF